ncbi:nucleobase:cation symporter-2 family protein [Fredinandcohnia sp. QZ13]|uniref:nucleobase:cation symporter-2 family protein n=1 Tax=Fredinandcohnia sp. QZ13 TaxID=3073144 RepID=UPI0028532B5A|nr:nucleobase:cation symporter-2 family protein [Fredinandcohnia sp. QZ13]MDR4890112.1 nucleobase:cation symporter-2 family protein [Fredinandcohnia sp. QZ13]
MKGNLFKTASLGIQHVLAMYAGAVIVPLIVGGAIGLSGEQLTYLVSIDLLMCGIATILQVWKNKFFGIGLPVMLGCTFTAVGPMIAIGGQYGVSAIYGSILAGGVFLVLVSTIFGKLVKYFPPVVTGSVVTIIGITLIPVAMNDMAGGVGSTDFGSVQNLALSFGTLFFILVLYRFAKGFMRQIAILLGLIVGTAVAYFLGKVDFSAVADASWMHMPKPFYFGMPTFEPSAIIMMILVLIVGLVEASGVYFALSDITGKKLSEKEISKGYRAEGIATILGGIFNAFPYTTYSQNVGLIQLSGVKKNTVIYAAGAFLIILGFLPKVGAFTTVIPTPVLGGAMLAMFGMVISAGIKMLSKVDFSSQENLLIMACSIGMGLGITTVPTLFANLPEGMQIITSNGIVIGSLTAIVMNLIFMKKPSEKAVQVLEGQKAS